ncbi:hypothetical protein GTM70_000874 [Salmonella enterica]|nr:hypothetical protein [Salmonella enterica]
MDRNRQVNKVVHFLLTLLIMFAVSIAPAQALLKGGTWQELNSVTGAVNGTAPLADGAIIPLYQGSTLLDPSKTHDIEFSAMPRDFSADATSTSMRAVNSTDTEGDLFSDPPTIAWENRQPPAMGLVWADAATPDTPLSPQPVPNLTFCAQNLAGRQLVAWAQVEDETNVPALWLFTNTGVPNYTTIPLLSPKVALNIKPAVSDPVSVSGDHVDASFEASKVKVGESITLTVTTKACDGEPAINAPFVIRREDAINRQGVVNNANPVRVGNTELTTAQTEYHGVTDGQGNATVVVTQENGPGVKTRLIVSSQNYPTLTDNVDVIFTTITSPDSDKASMYGHMIESTTATLNGITYTFTRPKLAAEASGADKSVVDTNETWALFTWSGADNHCDILPDAEQLVQMRHEHSTLETWTGWPVAGDAEYWSSTKNQLSGYHSAVHMNSASVVRAADSDTLLVSCVDKAQPAAHPQITLSPQGPYKAQVGESIDLTMTVVDRDTQKPLPYRYMELFIDPAKNRKGEHQDAWDNLRVTVDSEGMSASSPEHYTGVTDVNGQAHLTLKHNSGLGVETPIRIVMPDDEGGNVELSFSVIFTVVTSPDVDGANMWGHMRGVVDAGNLYKRPLLAVEASHKDGQFSENNEEWATFNSVASATAQCGVGQVPDQSSLAHLYSEHTGGQMESEHGWPTEDYFIAADSDASGTVHVNLENGDSGKFTDTPNYLTCSANEMVAVLDVYFNDDPVIKNADAKVGEQVKMNIHSRNALNGIAIGNTDFTITMANGRRRDGLTTGFTDTSNGEMQFDDVGYVAGQVYHGITDANGDATIILTQKKGVGLLTPLSIVPVNSYINTPVSRSVKFTVATSPDTAKAKMWGHMADTITVGDWTFERPKLAGEVSNPLRTQDESNETWARVAHSDAVGNPDAGGCAANRLPRIDQLEALYNANSGGKIHSIQGWPTYLNYWSSTYQSATTWKLIALTNGSEFANSNVSIYASCLASDNPVAASITIEPVNPSQWYDGSDVHAVKVKKGETMQLKVTVKDASGNPIPEAPFVLTRGDGYDRRGEKYTAQDGDDLQGIVTPVVIDGESLAWTTTKMGSQTGTDGTRIISVTRPDTHGTRTAINATLYENAAVSASIDTIFTVVTSPDVSVARMWGHMAPSLTAADGAVYQRPLLYAELSSTDNTASKQETNETWAVFHGPASEGANPARCAAGYYPAVEALDSLYSKYPSRTINTAQGWPVYYSYWSGSNSTSFSSGAKLDFYYAVDLADGSRRSENSATSTAWQYQICATTPLPQATQITLTSPQAMDDAIQAVKAKNSESIPLLITTTDAMGNPVPYATFSLKRDAGKARNTDYNKFVATNGTNMTVTPLTGAQQQFYYATSVLTGATGADGTLALTLAEPGGVGLKNVLTANLNDTPTATSSLPVVFTVLTSPDSDKANMYGHMPETFTASNGAEFKRPLVAGEPSSEAHTDTYFETNENWIMVNSFNTGNYGGCPMNQMAAIDDFTALYNDHPSGKVATDIGLPVGKRWWAGDSLLKGSTLYWQYKDLKTGKNYSMSENPGNYYLQLCLTLTLAGQDETTGSAKAKKGEQMAATIDVKDAAGQPMKNVMVKISRGSSYNRANSATSSSSITDDITLRNVMPSGLATYLLDTSAKYLYAQTDALGQVTFTLAQDSTAGLKTTISAATMDGSNLTDSKGAIFTVVTSPDSDKAKYWGHMPETFTNSKGVEFKRPLLRAELSSTADTSGYTENNETWYTWSRYPNMYQDTASPCDRLGLPTVNDLQTLYTDYPNGALTTTLGLPVASGKYWGAGNSVPDATHSDSQFQYVRLSDNNTLTTKANTATAQLCLAKRRDLSIELTSSDMDADKGAPVAKKGESLPLTVTVRDGSGTPQPNTAIRLGRTLSIDRAGVVDGSSGGGMVLTSVAPSTGSMTFNCTVSSCTSYWYGITDEDGKAQLEVTQDDSRGLRTPLQAMLVDDPLTVSDMDVIFTVITSPDSDKAKYWGHMPETVTNSAGVKFRRPLLAAEMTSNSGTYLVNNETWPLVTAANTEKAGATGCDAEYQPLSGDLQTLYSDNPNGAIGTNYGWPVAGNKSWWAADRAPNTGYYQFINLNSGGKGTASSSTATGAQVCLVEPRTSTPASITLTSTAMDSAKNAAVVAKGSAMPLTVTVKDSSGNPVANVGFTLSRGDSKNRAGMVITDGDVAADAGADDLMLKELTPASASQSMTTTGIVFTGTTGSDGTATFTLNQDKSLGLKTPLTVKVTDNTTLHASLDVIFMVLTSPDTDKALFWGNMSDTTSVNGKTLHRPWLQAEMLSGVTPVFTNGVHANNEYWAMAHTVDNTKWDIAKQCGSLSKAPDNNDLLTLYHSISSLGWPTQGYPYLSKSSSSGGMYCGVDENTKSQNCAIKPAGTAGYATCVE